MIFSSKGSLYTGITTDVERRWLQHTGKKKGGAKFFNGQKPVSLAYVEPGHNRSSASKREAEIKKLSRKQKEIILQEAQNGVDNYSSTLPVKRISPL